MTDKERAELYAKALQAIVEYVKAVRSYRKPDTALSEVLELAVAALAEGA